MAVPGSLGFTFSWPPGDSPRVTTNREDLIQQICTDLNTQDASIVPDARLLRNGIALQSFWVILKLSASLKCDAYYWWRLDECTKHLLASWIIAQAQPKLHLADNPILWEVYPTMIIGSVVQARVAQRRDRVYYFDPNVSPESYVLYGWNVDVDKGSYYELPELSLPSMASSNSTTPEVDNGGPIVRTWTATATRSGAEQYHQYFAKTLLPEVRKLRGFVGGYLLSRDLTPVSSSTVGGQEETTVELTTHTFWYSMDTIRAFAGDDVGASLVEPEARACLLDYDRTATHKILLVDGRT